MNSKELTISAVAAGAAVLEKKKKKKKIMQKNVKLINNSSKRKLLNRQNFIKTTSSSPSHFLNLILQYKYPLNDEQSKYISIGYSNETEFQTAIVISKTNKSFVPLSVNSWKIIAVYAKQFINNYFEQHVCDDLDFRKRRIFDTPSIRLIKVKCGNVRMIRIENVAETLDSQRSIQLDFNEWKNILNFSEFFNEILDYYDKHSSIAENYYQTYTVNCILKGKSRLDKSDIFQSNNKGVKLNFYRLFFEIPILSATRLRRDLHELIQLSSASSQPAAVTAAAAEELEAMKVVADEREEGREDALSSIAVISVPVNNSIYSNAYQIDLHS